MSPIYYLTNNLRIQSVENSEYVTVGIEFKGAYLLGIYAVAGVVFLIAAYQLYKWRKLETAGDLISMRGIKPVFRWGVAVCAGLLGGTAVADTIGNSFSSAKVHFWILAAGTLIFGAIGFLWRRCLLRRISVCSTKESWGMGSLNGCSGSISGCTETGSIPDRRKNTGCFRG